MKLPHATVLPLVLLAASAPALAQKMAPGLWETTMAMKGADGKMDDMGARIQAQMANLPPEQRKKMEEMLAKQGATVSGAGPGAVRMCISKEQAERNEPPVSPDGNCRNEGMQRSGAVLTYRFACTNPPTKGTGEFKLVGDKAFEGRMLIEGGAGGRAGITEMRQTGKWIGADCGALKPRS